MIFRKIATENMFGFLVRRAIKLGQCNKVYPYTISITPTYNGEC